MGPNLKILEDVLGMFTSYWVRDEQYFTKTDCFLKFGHQVFILLCHSLDLHLEFPFCVDKLSQLSLQSTHLHVFQLLVLRSGGTQTNLLVQRACCTLIDS